MSPYFKSSINCIDDLKSFMKLYGKAVEEKQKISQTSAVTGERVKYFITLPFVGQA